MIKGRNFVGEMLANGVLNDNRNQNAVPVICIATPNPPDYDSWVLFKLTLKFLKLVLFSLMMVAALSCQRHSEADLRGRVRRIVLSNGMTFLLLKREVAPVFSAHLYVRVGSIEEEPGASGLAHFFEHMAFKGTDKIGTRDFESEKTILAEVLSVGTKIARMRREGKPRDEYAELLQRRRELEKQEDLYIEKNEFFNILQRNGANDLNASTGNDGTSYYVSLPANKLELWAYMESERLRQRVFREFFTEADVVAEERRMNIDNSPDGRLYEAFMGAAFRNSPYRRITIGSAADIQTYTPDEAAAFYSRYYLPSRMIAAVVGNFDVDFAEGVIRKYFSDFPRGQDEPEAFSVENFEDNQPRTVTIKDDSPPRFFLGYHRPAYPHQDDIVLDVLEGILCDGTTARLYKRLVLKDRSVAEIDCYASFPGDRLDSLFVFAISPVGKHTNHDIQSVIADELRILMQNGPTPEELEIVGNKIDAELVYALDSNSGLASMLSFYESLTGRWEYIYDLQRRIHEVSATDIQRVLGVYFTPAREVIANLETE